MIGRTTLPGQVLGKGADTIPAAAMKYGRSHSSLPENADPFENPVAKMRCGSMHIAVARSASRSSTNVTSLVPVSVQPLGAPVPSGEMTTYPLAVARGGKRE